MRIIQTYTTELWDVEGNYGVGIFVAPRDACSPAVALHIKRQTKTVQETSKLLDIKLIGSHGDHPIESWLVSALSYFPGAMEIPPDLLNFVAYIRDARIVPFQESPLDLRSLSEIAIGATRAGPIPLGATVGFVAAREHLPLCLITVPAGIVLVGAAYSLSTWVRENHNKIWGKWLLNDRSGIIEEKTIPKKNIPGLGPIERPRATEVGEDTHADDVRPV